MHARLLSGAARELVKAEARYEKEQEGLGTAFYLEIRSLLSTIVRQPHRFPIHGTGVRWGLAKRFPYAVIYQARTDEIVIVAIMHTSRLPGYWQRRVTKK
jgi:toxin ParE1/3/4